MVAPQASRMHARMFTATLNKVTKFTSLMDSRTVDQKAQWHPTAGSHHLQLTTTYRFDVSQK